MLSIDPFYIFSVFSNPNPCLPDRQFIHEISAGVFTIAVDMMKELRKAIKV